MPFYGASMRAIVRDTLRRSEDREHMWARASRRHHEGAWIAPNPTLVHDIAVDVTGLHARESNYKLPPCKHETLVFMTELDIVQNRVGNMQIHNSC